MKSTFFNSCIGIYQLLELYSNVVDGESGKVVVPHRGSDTFISTIGHIDGRIDLYKGESLVGDISNGVHTDLGHRALMDLCIMASKLAYENAKVVKNIVTHHWKAS